MKAFILSFLVSIFSCLISFQVSASQEPEQKWRNFPFVEKAFFEVALKSEFKSGQSPLLKWQVPIKYWVKHDVPNQNLHDELLSKHFQHLNQITNLTFTKVNGRSKANMLIFFTQRSLWNDIVKREMGVNSTQNTYGSVCMFNIRANQSTSRITKAVIVIPVDQAREHGKLISCIVEETTQALGLKNDSESAYPSIFNDKTPDSFLTPLDIVLLKLMYSREIKPGMDQTHLKPVLAKKYKEMQRNGELDNALYQAVHSPLRTFVEI